MQYWKRITKPKNLFFEKINFSKSNFHSIFSKILGWMFSWRLGMCQLMIFFNEIVQYSTNSSIIWFERRSTRKFDLAVVYFIDIASIFIDVISLEPLQTLRELVKEQIVIFLVAKFFVSFDKAGISIDNRFGSLFNFECAPQTLPAFLHIHIIELQTLLHFGLVLFMKLSDFGAVLLTKVSVHLLDDVVCDLIEFLVHRQLIIIGELP